MFSSVDKSKCISCGACIEVCMKDVLRWDSTSTHPEPKYFEDCQTCFDCEITCPAKAIYVHPQHRETVLAW